MKSTSLLSRLRVGLLAALLASPHLSPAQATAPVYPAGAGFDKAGSDARAVAIADRVMAQMGGYPAWQQARFLAWSFLDGSYQIWDKYTGDFLWEKGDLVANYNLNTKRGHAYRAGQDISTSEEGKKLIANLYPIWVNNSWWLVMPFKLKDSGVTLTYKGQAKTQQGTPADVLQMTFKNVGVTPDNRYEVLVNPKTGLVEEWAYFPKAADAKPAFRRRWADYSRHGNLLLAADRSDATKPARLNDIAVASALPATLMHSRRPVAKLK